MSNPPSGLFHGTMGEIAFRGDAESVIAKRVKGLDLREHPVTQKQLSPKTRRALAKKIKNRTATREEYNRYMWDKRFANRRKRGIKKYWKEERNRLELGEQGTRNWTEGQKAAILSGRTPMFNGKPMQAHHTYSASKYPHLADKGVVIYPATHLEHHKGWHGGSYKDSLLGRRIRPIQEF